MTKKEVVKSFTATNLSPLKLSLIFMSVVDEKVVIGNIIDCLYQFVIRGNKSAQQHSCGSALPQTDTTHCCSQRTTTTTTPTTTRAAPAPAGTTYWNSHDHVQTTLTKSQITYTIYLQGQTKATILTHTLDFFRT